MTNRVMRPFLEEMFWNLDINAGSSVYYLKEENRKWGELFGATVSRILLRLEGRVRFSGSWTAL